MAYSSNNLKQTWTYNYDGDTHNDRVGRLLSGGHDLRQTSKLEATANANYLRDLEAAQKKSEAQKSATAAAASPNQSANNSKAGTPDGRGMVWVDGTGAVLGNCSTETFKEPFRTSSNLDGLNARQVAAVTMSPLDRSVTLWKKVQPGVMESTTKLPKSTMKDHFIYKKESAYDLDHTHHYKKSDFTEYIENKLKVGNAIT